jgi:hypothetical protein
VFVCCECSCVACLCVLCLVSCVCVWSTVRPREPLHSIRAQLSSSRPIYLCRSYLSVSVCMYSSLAAPKTLPVRRNLHGFRILTTPNDLHNSLLLHHCYYPRDVRSTNKNSSRGQVCTADASSRSVERGGFKPHAVTLRQRVEFHNRAAYLE